MSPADALDWKTETVDSAGDVGHYSSIALDSSGNPRISYLDFTNYRLKYAAKTDGVWISGSVDMTHAAGEYGSLKIDATGQPFVSYYDANQGNLSFATKTGDTWTRTTVDSGNVGRYTSLALDSSGNPRIAYQDLLNMKLKYAEKIGDIWIIETVDNSGNVGTYSSLALDSAGNPGISYYDAGHGYLRFAQKSGNQWTCSTVDNTGNAGTYTSLAFDRQGNPCISYYDALNKDLKVASKTGGTWKKEIVDSTGSVGLYTSLVLDEADNFRISYYDLTNGHLKYASKSGSMWYNETVDTSPDVGLYSSLALDSEGNPRISYRDGGNGDLRYATGIPPLILNFTASPRSGIAPMTVEFSDESTGGQPSCWNWSFGDGAWFNTSIVSLRDPEHVYTLAGTYSVTLIIQNISVATGLTRSEYISIAVPPETTVPADSPTPAPTSTSTPTLSPTPVPTSSPTPSFSPTPSPSSSPSPTLSPTPAVTPTIVVPVPLPAFDWGSDGPPSTQSLTVSQQHTGPQSCQTVQVGGDSAISRVTVTGWDISDIIITSRKITPLPPQVIPLGTPVYQYIDLMPARYTTISAALIEFDVPLSFIDENHATADEIGLWILRNQTWFRLPTRALGNKNGRACYSADSPEFLLFAVARGNKTFAAQEKVAFPVPPGEDIIAEDKSEKPVVPFPSQTKVLPTPADPGSGSPGLQVIAGITGFCGFGIGAIIIRRRWIRR